MSPSEQDNSDDTPSSQSLHLLDILALLSEQRFSVAPTGRVVVWGVLEVDGVPAGPDKRSALVWRAGGVEVVGV